MKLIANKKEIKKSMIDLDLNYESLSAELNITRQYLNRLLNTYVPEKIAYKIVDLFGGEITKYFKAEFSREEIELYNEFFESGELIKSGQK
ncbi:hypothetical protein QVA60_01515 [Staphylococcus chromogenes]|uniref:hypothetical protein n=1 Tax=Staphylococcus chromogenes TaxID=46126 RepID=UPI00290308BA|nr:hypothetical protein [Staphylococcus chromogenes]MDU0429163.1 hypothetical protein [Staphylococcus chromogenes]